MNTQHSQNYFWKRFFTKKSTWIILLIHLFIVGVLFFIIRENTWTIGMQRREVIRGSSEGYNMLINPKIDSVNDFFACIFPNLIFLPLFLWTWFFLPLSWLFWWRFDEVGQATQTDGTDLFFLSTEIPTSRKQVFWGKVTFLAKFFSILHLVLLALPLALLLWKANYFSNFTGLQTGLFLVWNFLITPLFLLVPLAVLLFSLASLESVWYTILKWLGRLSIIFLTILGFMVLQALYHGGEAGKKILEWGGDFFQWLGQNYLLTTLSIMGVIIVLALFTLSLAYRDYQKKDLH